MFHCPYCLNTNDNYREDYMTSHIRFLNAIQNAPAIDIYANDVIIIKNLIYKNFSEYLPFPSGYYNIKIYPAGRKITPLINTNISVSPRTVSTLAATGILPNISIYNVPEESQRIPQGKSCIRFIHLSPNSPRVDITLSGNDKVFQGVSYKEVTKYHCIPHGKHSLQIQLAGTNETILINPNMKLLPDKNYSIYFVGQRNSNSPLQILIALDGRSYIPG